MKPILCSDCFKDYGLREMAKKIGKANSVVCPQCNSITGAALDKKGLEELCDHYFVHGSYNNAEYGGSPVLMIGEGDGEFDYSVHKSLNHDIQLIHEAAGLTPMAYGPAVWRVGVSEWMDRLTSRNWKKRDRAVKELISRCSIKEIKPDSRFFRIRTNVVDDVNEKSFDAPESQKYKSGRFNVKDGVVFYASFDVETCIHECRVSMEDYLYVATMEPLRTLRLLDLNQVKEKESEETPSENLSLAIRQILRAGGHSYGVTRRISELAKSQGLDGIIYPSYFNSVRNKPYINIALYGQVIKNKDVRVKSIDRILLGQVKYKFAYGPCFI